MEMERRAARKGRMASSSAIASRYGVLVFIFIKYNKNLEIHMLEEPRALLRAPWSNEQMPRSWHLSQPLHSREFFFNFMVIFC